MKQDLAIPIGDYYKTMTIPETKSEFSFYIHHCYLTYSIILILGDRLIAKKMEILN